MFLLLICLSFFLSGCENLISNKPYKYNRTHKTYTIRNSHGTFKVTPKKSIQFTQNGIASYYGKECHGKLTALGTPFNMHAYTAAHQTAHLPSVALVTHGKHSRVVLINDRGPFAKDRILDCSHKLAQDLGYERAGHAKIHIKVLKNETLSLKENGGHVVWDGTRPFPLVTNNISHCCHFYPKGQINKASRGKVVGTKLTLRTGNPVSENVYRLRPGAKVIIKRKTSSVKN